MTPAPLLVDEVTDPAALAALETDWRRLVAESTHVTPFQTWEWASNWWAHLGQGRLYILVARDRGVTVGLCPLVITRWRGTPVRQLRFLGAPHADYQDVICATPRASEITAAFLAHLARRKPMWDIADLNDLRAASALPQAPRLNPCVVRSSFIADAL